MVYISRDASTNVRMAFGLKLASTELANFDKVSPFGMLLDYLGAYYSNDEKLLDIIDKGWVKLIKLSAITVAENTTPSNRIEVGELYGAIGFFLATSTEVDECFNVMIAVVNEKVVKCAVIGKVPSIFTVNPDEPTSNETYSCTEPHFSMHDKEKYPLGADMKMYLTNGDLTVGGLTIHQRDIESVRFSVANSWVIFRTATGSDFLLLPSGGIFKVTLRMKKRSRECSIINSVTREEFLESMYNKEYDTNMQAAEYVKSNITNKIMEQYEEESQFIPKLVVSKVDNMKRYERYMDALNRIGHKLEKKWFDVALGKSLNTTKNIDLEDGYSVTTYSTNQVVAHNAKKDITAGGADVTVYRVKNGNRDVGYWSVGKTPDNFELATGTFNVMSVESYVAFESDDSGTPVLIPPRIKSKLFVLSDKTATIDISSFDTASNRNEDPLRYASSRMNRPDIADITSKEVIDISNEMVLKCGHEWCRAMKASCRTGSGVLNYLESLIIDNNVMKQLINLYGATLDGDASVTPLWFKVNSEKKQMAPCVFVEDVKAENTGEILLEANHDTSHSGLDKANYENRGIKTEYETLTFVSETYNTQTGGKRRIKTFKHEGLLKGQYLCAVIKVNNLYFKCKDGTKINVILPILIEAENYIMESIESTYMVHESTTPTSYGYEKSRRSNLHSEMRIKRIIVLEDITELENVRSTGGMDRALRYYNLACRQTLVQLLCTRFIFSEHRYNNAIPEFCRNVFGSEVGGIRDANRVASYLAFRTATEHAGKIDVLNKYDLGIGRKVDTNDGEIYMTIYFEGSVFKLSMKALKSRDAKCTMALKDREAAIRVSRFIREDKSITPITPFVQYMDVVADLYSHGEYKKYVYYEMLKLIANKSDLKTVEDMTVINFMMNILDNVALPYELLQSDICDEYKHTGISMADIEAMNSLSIDDDDDEEEYNDDDYEYEINFDEDGEDLEDEEDYSYEVETGDEDEELEDEDDSELLDEEDELEMSEEDEALLAEDEDEYNEEDDEDFSDIEGYASNVGTTETDGTDNYGLDDIEDLEEEEENILTEDQLMDDSMGSFTDEDGITRTWVEVMSQYCSSNEQTKGYANDFESLKLLWQHSYTEALAKGTVEQTLQFLWNRSI